jgi:hypothetical protein
MYSFPGANHNLRRTRVKERAKLYNISTIAMAFSLCLAQQAQAGAISISNRNCALQGLSRTNQTKFFLFAFAGDHGEDKPPNVTFDKDCTSEWFTLRVGYTKTLQVASWIRYVGSWATQCHYGVQAEGAFLSNDHVLGKDISKYVCELDWLDVCSCRTE